MVTKVHKGWQHQISFVVPTAQSTLFQREVVAMVVEMHHDRQRHTRQLATTIQPFHQGKTGPPPKERKDAKRRTRVGSTRYSRRSGPNCM